MNDLSRLLACAAALGLASNALAALETWTNLDGAKMQAEFQGRKGDYVVFTKDDGTRYVYPYAKLNEADRARIDVLAAASPAPTDAAPSVAGAASAAAPAPAARVGSVPAALAGKLVAVQGKTLAPSPRGALDGARYIAFYHSAHWCPPCRAFTPELVAAYDEIKAAHPEFELVFVSHDENAAAMKRYMTDYRMTWPALKFDQIEQSRVTRRPDHESGIPNLVFMDADGKELSRSFTPGGDYRGPKAVLADIRKHFKM